MTLFTWLRRLIFGPTIREILEDHIREINKNPDSVKLLNQGTKLELDDISSLIKVEIDTSIPPGEAHLFGPDGKLVGKIVNLKVTKRETSS